MWNRVISGLLLMLFASAALALDFPTLFTPVKEDLSVWYLANIFGSELLPIQNAPNIQLLSRLFGVFNSIALAVALVILVYTIAVGTLNTAAEGKPLGEKWGSFLIPIRIATGVGLLIPKAGTHYCMAQFVVMWLTLQGIGAADSVWTTMIDYFKSGGMIYTSATTNTLVKSTPFTYENMNYTYSLQSTSGVGVPVKNEKVSLLRSMTCMQKFNSQPERDRESIKYKMYSEKEITDAGVQDFILFGNPERYTFENNEVTAGDECGAVIIKATGKEQTVGNDQQIPVNDVYALALQAYAKNGTALTKEIALNEPDTEWERYYIDMNRGMQIYINEIVRSQPILQVPASVTSSSPLDYFAKYGWILAGNYYTTLSCWGSRTECAGGTAMAGGSFIYPGDAKAPSQFVYIEPSWNGIEGHDKETVAAIDTFFSKFQTNQEAMYSAPDSEWEREQAKSQSPATSPISEEGLTGIKEAVGHHNPNPTSSVTAASVKTFIQKLSGAPGGGRWAAQDPILQAANYGKELMDAAIGMMITFSTTWMATILVASLYSAMNPMPHGLNAVNSIIAPLMMGLGGFMYSEGVVLGVFIPIIPYLIFITGVIGWMLQVVESVAAAPLVAVGLVLPEGKEDIWGRAAPAYMLTLNLFLRPSLMIIGFAAAMILTWVIIELVNIGFLTLVESTFRVENMFGFVTIMAAYVATFTYVVTETYSLINVLPNRVLHWIGDQSMGVKGAEEAIGGAKQGAEAGGRAVGAGAQFTQKADMYRAQASGKEVAKERDQKPPPGRAEG